jgi:hypothetical protein
LKEFIFVLYFKINTMKKKISSIVFVAAIAVSATWNFTQNQKEAALSDVVLENVEALASGEAGGACSNCSFNAYTICWRTAFDGCYGTYSGPIDV